ncbi:MAG: UDP-N-acetylglucosamine 1-carboxyvinyltransferase [Candidatus Sumerlaeia bacterium]|nr:UDP-N-acetylglucosamine 1-carboxyvinyltransferase [Candidatus Sumerlaeia bacterium]
MDMYQIEGAKSLRGDVPLSGSKNACLPIITAALLGEGPSTIHGVPDLFDIRNLRLLVEHLGASVEFSDGTLTIDPAGVNRDYVPYDMMCRMRASFYAMGPLLARYGRAKVSLPGGCAIGDRPVDLHTRGFQDLGAQLGESNGYIVARSPGKRLKGSRLSLLGSNGTSVGATCNVMMAATLAEGVTLIDDAAREPDVVELAAFLRAMGARISGEGTSTIRIEGVEKLHGAEWTVCTDRIEAATFAIAALVTHGDVVLRGAVRPHLYSTLLALDLWGAELTWVGENDLRVRRSRHAKHPLQVVTEPWPGFPTDVQSQLTVLLALTPGESYIRETIYPERFKHVHELKRLGAKISVPEKGRIQITGVPALRGAVVKATDLRAGAALVTAALAAHGTSQIRDIEHISRGYENLEQKLIDLGAGICTLPVADSDPGLDGHTHHDTNDAVSQADPSELETLAGDVV